MADGPSKRRAERNPNFWLAVGAIGTAVAAVVAVVNLVIPGLDPAYKCALYLGPCEGNSLKHQAASASNLAPDPPQQAPQAPSAAAANGLQGKWQGVYDCKDKNNRLDFRAVATLALSALSPGGDAQGTMTLVGGPNLDLARLPSGEFAVNGTLGQGNALDLTPDYAAGASGFFPRRFHLIHTGSAPADVLQGPVDNEGMTNCPNATIALQRNAP